MQWYKTNQRLFREERDALASKHPRLKLRILGPGASINPYIGLKREPAVAMGVFVLEVADTTRKYEYQIALVFPDDYPKHPPQMYVNDEKLPINIDRHIVHGGQACLGAPSEIQHRWMSAPNIVSFLDEIIGSFLVWQIYYDAYGSSPEWGQRSHGKEGILEFYTEILGFERNVNIAGFMTLLARKNPPGGHELCPCGSGQRLRTCHREVVFKAREKVDWQAVKVDIELLKLPEVPKAPAVR
jgi:hypothetical protein